MKKTIYPVLLLAGLFLVALLFPLSPGEPPSDANTLTRIGDAQRVRTAYEKWEGGYMRSSEGAALVIGLTWFKGLSVEQSTAKGRAEINQARGSVNVEIYGLPQDRPMDVWLVDNRPGPGHSVRPEAHDVLRNLGTLAVEDGVGRLQRALTPEAFDDFDVDLVAVTYSGLSPAEGGLLFGAPSLFQRLNRREQRTLAGLPPVAGPVSVSDLGPAPAYAYRAADALDELVDLGESLFMNETFGGNGRTCATCHPPDNSFTIDPAYIATLPPNDPLFVAEYTPALDADLNGGLIFERPVLMRQFGLIVANTDGFDDLANKYTMRSPNHLAALLLTVDPSPIDGSTTPPNHRLGWGGDGAPGNGTIREFAIGAIAQHAPLTLARQAGVDYRLPTDEELDAIEAFMLTLGRQAELDLETMALSDPDVNAGRDLYLRSTNDPDNGLKAAKCQRCHANGGALRPVGRPNAHTNFNFNIGTNLLAHPADLIGEDFPFDGGFGTELNAEGGYGMNKFNSTSIIESADTGPYFHNNAVNTLEEAVEFYNSDEFNLLSEDGNRIRVEDNGLPIDLSPLEVNQVGALLRVLNALDNMQTVLACDDRARLKPDPPSMKAVVELCLADNEDAVQVLTDGPLSLHPIAVQHLQNSADFHREALAATTRQRVLNVLDAAAVELEDARLDITVGTPLPVELAAFDARVDGPQVQLQWETLSERNNAGFEIQHQPTPGDGWTRVGFTEGAGTTNEAQRYGFSIEALAPGRHHFRLKQIDFDGAFGFSPEIEVTVEVPEAYVLSQAYPNPFNPQAQFTLSVQQVQQVRIVVYDAAGRERARLHDGPMEVHRSYTFTLDGAGWSSGLYFYKITGERFQTARSVMLVK